MSTQPSTKIPPLAAMLAVSLAVGVLSLTLCTVPALAADSSYVRPQWADTDGDCQDTRAEVLIRSCLEELDARGCRVVRAVCVDPYAGVQIAADTAAGIEIDHILPASVAWYRRTWRDDHGNRCKTADRCTEYVRFYNDPANLLPIRARTNRQKGDDMPHEWCPASPGARRWLAARFKAIADRYRIPLAAGELRGLDAWAQGECADGSRMLGAP